MSAISCNTDLYQQLLSLPENRIGEIINGQLHTHPRPAGPHAIAASTLGMDVGGAFQRGRGGPGGWWIIDEPELHLRLDTEVMVPDLAGWRQERMPAIPRDHRFTIIPDWICEVLSPSTAKLDRIEKMPLYARYGVSYLWLVDPLAQTLEVFALYDEHCMLMGSYQGAETPRAVPFEALALTLNDLWPSPGQQAQ